MDGTIRRIAERMRLIIGRGKIQQSNDSGLVQMVQVKLSALELADLQRIVDFGFASWPPDNATAVCVFVNGDRSNGVVLGTHDLPSRFKLGNKGETAIFDANGAAGAAGKWIWLKKGAGIEIQANGEDVVVNNAKGVTITAGADGVVLNLQGNVTLNMNGKSVTITNPGSVVLSDQNGEKAVVRDGDSVSAGVVHASQTAVKA